MRKIYNICLMSHVGNSRTNQEDRYLVGPDRHGRMETGEIDRMRSGVEEICRELQVAHAVVAVSDGMGGHACGEIASAMVVTQLAARADALTACPTDAALISSIADINRSVQESAKLRAECRGMGATLCGVVLAQDGQIVGFNVGDSRLYQCSEGQLHPLSRDHTEGRRLVDLQLLTEQEVEHFPHRKSLYKYIGMRSDLVADVIEIGRCKAGDLLLICTDGLSDAVSNAEIADCLNAAKPLKARAERLMRSALEQNQGHGDNITFVLIEF